MIWLDTYLAYYSSIPVNYIDKHIRLNDSLIWTNNMFFFFWPTKEDKDSYQIASSEKILGALPKFSKMWLDGATDNAAPMSHVRLQNPKSFKSKFGCGYLWLGELLPYT